jgi:hypothetical protein
MTNKIYYEKIGRRYVPVYEYDQTLMDALPKGNHLVQVYPGGGSRRYNIDPAYAPMIAAGRVAEDAICKAFSKASELKPQRPLLTEGQRKAWENLAKEFGEELCTLQGTSARDCAEAGVNAMMEEADKLLTNPTIRKAYENFLFVAKLSGQEHINE